VFPGNHDEYLQSAIRVLIPEYNNYIEQHNSQYGDKSDAAKKFLFNTIPFLVETVLQNCIYFTRDYPNHHFTYLINATLPSSTRCRDARCLSY
jgi:hypothetical protein